MKSRFREQFIVGILLLAAALAVAGCGSGGSTPTAVSRRPEIPFGSPVVSAVSKLIPARYKCDATKIWLPVRWGALPAHTEELALYIVRFGAPQLIGGGKAKAEVKATAILVGIKPRLHGLSVGKLPPGALLGVHAPNNPQASICPPKGTTQQLLFRLYALPHKLGLTKSSQGSNILNRIGTESLESGAFIAAYRST